MKVHVRHATSTTTAFRNRTAGGRVSIRDLSYNQRTGRTHLFLERMTRTYTRMVDITSTQGYEATVTISSQPQHGYILTALDPEAKRTLS